MAPDDAVDQPDPEAATVTSSKVGRLLEEYDLQAVGDELEDRWLGRSGHRESLRSLADYFNRLLLETRLEAAGETPIAGEVENLYRVLTDADSSRADLVEAESRLERTGVDVDGLRDDFVSHQAVHNYLRDVRDVEHGSAAEDTATVIENRRSAIQRLRGRLSTVTDRTLAALDRADHLTLGSFEVVVGVTVHCADCGISRDVTELLGQGGCACEASPG